MTKDELTSMQPARNSGQIMGPGVDEIFARLDANHDGGIDESENLASMQPSETRRQRQPLGASEIARALFKRADTDTDGKLTKEEFLAALPKHQASPALDELFKDADEDPDGAISQSELETGLRKHLSERAAYDRLGQTNAITKSRFSIVL
jgi:Ca2+-binding EF-hand superfamily protein